MVDSRNLHANSFQLISLGLLHRHEFAHLWQSGRQFFNHRLRVASRRPTPNNSNDDDD